MMNQEFNSRNIFDTGKYGNYMIQYEGTYNTENNTEEYIITPIDREYAILSVNSKLLVNFSMTNSFNKFVTEKFESDNFRVVYIQPTEFYTLQDISAIEASGVNLIQSDTVLDLSGKGVVIGIVDTGIDYLNEEFTDDQGNTRIKLIWDQTIHSESEDSKKVPFGAIYTSEDINKALEAKRNGGDPYEIVPTKDKNGHGTNMAGVVGASGKNPNLKGMAPKCEFIIIKLAEAEILKINNKVPSEVAVFGPAPIFSAIELLRKYSDSVNSPMVILLPLGTNTGNHKGKNMLDNYLANVVSNIGIAIVSGTGNQGNEDGHVSGILSKVDDVDNIEIIITEERKYFYFEIWVDLPNIVQIDLISPSGQSAGSTDVNSLNDELYYDFVLDNTKSVVYYNFIERYSGDQLIRVYLENAKPGIWSLSLKLIYGENAKFNIWMLQKELVAPGTRFSPSDPYGTVTIPSDSTQVITVAAYNQNNNHLLAYSGKAFKYDESDKIDFAAGGVNTLTVGINNTTKLINGTSLSAAVGAGVCALIFEWGIVQKNAAYLYTQSLKTYLHRGTIKRTGDVYPNVYLGFGIINLYEVFKNIN